jgi:hypothetical protein
LLHGQAGAALRSGAVALAERTADHGHEVDMSSAVAYVHVPELAVKTLACAVIKQALADALDPTTPEDVRRDAEQFLAGDSWFKQWCVAAEMTPVRLITRRHTA